MSLWKIIVAAPLLVFGSGVVGFSIGDGIGRNMPEYYRTVAAAGSRADFDPIAFGRGQGLTQGLGVGVVLTMALVVLATWHSHRGRLHAELESLSAQVERLDRAVSRLNDRMSQPP